MIQLEEGLLFGAMIGALVKDKRVVDIGLVCINNAAYYLHHIVSDQTIESILSHTSKNIGSTGTISSAKYFKHTVADQFAETHNATQ